MKIRKQLISATTLAAAFLALTVTVYAQKPSAAKKTKTVPPTTVTVTAPAPSQAKYADEKTAPSPLTSQAAATTTTSADAPTTLATNKLISRPADSKLTLPVGTALRVKLSETLNTRDMRLGAHFSGTVTEAVVISGTTVIPQGSRITGRVANYGEPRRIAGKPWIDLRPETVTNAAGHTIAISAVAVDTSQPHKYPVSDEGRISGPSYKKTTAMGTGALAGTGALIGAHFAGPFGVLVGAGAGATLGTGHYLATHHSMTIPASLEVIFEINNSTPQTSAGSD